MSLTNCYVSHLHPTPPPQLSLNLLQINDFQNVYFHYQSINQSMNQSIRVAPPSSISCSIQHPSPLSLSPFFVSTFHQNEMHKTLHYLLSFSSLPLSLSHNLNIAMAGVQVLAAGPPSCPRIIKRTYVRTHTSKHSHAPTNFLLCVCFIMQTLYSTGGVCQLRVSNR